MSGCIEELLTQGSIINLFNFYNRRTKRYNFVLSSVTGLVFVGIRADWVAWLLSFSCTTHANSYGYRGIDSGLRRHITAGAFIGLGFPANRPATRDRRNDGGHFA